MKKVFDRTADLLSGPASCQVVVPHEDGMVDLSMGEIQFPADPEVEALLLEGVGRAATKYCDPFGTKSLKQEYVRFLASLGISNVTPENVLITAGGREAGWLTVMGLVDNEWTVVAPSPGWGPYRLWAKALGASITEYHPAELADPETFCQKNFKSRGQTLLIVNCPNNPTGLEIGQAVLDRLVDGAIENGATILSDEVYRAFSSTSSLSALKNKGCSEQLLVIDSTSKWIGLAGLRVGFLVGSPDFIRRAGLFRLSYAACASLACQTIALNALRSPRCRSWIDSAVQRTKSRLNHCIRVLADSKINIESSGGIYVWLHSSSAARLDACCKVKPGEAFGYPHHIRLCPVNLKSGLLSNYLLPPPDGAKNDR